MSDVEYLLHRGSYRFKALSRHAAEQFIEILKLPAGLLTGENVEVFITGVKPEVFGDWEQELRLRGLQIASAGSLVRTVPRPVDVASLTEF